MPILIGFDLLDRQILDVAGEAVGKVDDLELTVGDDGAPRIAALLVGPQALGRRLGGRLGRWVSGAAGRLHPAENPDPMRIPWSVVAQREHPVEAGSAVRLTVRRELLTEPALEQWLREHLIGRIPGADHAGN
jgi:sporulation protein YlmC with PRC-barrel domain